MEVLRLRDWIYFEFSDLESEPPESDKWSELALSWWNEDEAGKSTNNNINSMMSALTTDLDNTILWGLSLDSIDGKNLVREVVLDSESDSPQSSLQTRKDAHTPEIVIRLKSETHDGADNIHDREKSIDQNIRLPHPDTPRIEDANLP